MSTNGRPIYSAMSTHDVIQNLEDEVAWLLPEDRWVGRPPEPYLAARDRWTVAVWNAAVKAGPHLLEPEEVERGRELASRPVFVCGLHRSGTTLLRDLLDDHPQLSVLPSEGGYLTSLYPQITRLTDEEGLRFMGQEWIGRLANPTNAAPFWLLGRTTEEASPYVEFARWLAAWWDVLGGLMAPLQAVMLAYASIRGQRPKWLVEKTPTNELHMTRIRRALPGAKFIQVVRDPYSVFASRKRADEQVFGAFTSARSVLREMEQSYRLAEKADGAFHLVVSYEEMVSAQPYVVGSVVGNVMRFLDIKHHDALYHPTVAGLPAAANSSFSISAKPGEVLRVSTDRELGLSPEERKAVTAVAGENAVWLGYEADAMSGIERWAIRLRLRLPGKR